jgi:polysaccharide deacetylase 2 family uncharacterized protein YibQ
VVLLVLLSGAVVLQTLGPPPQLAATPRVAAARPVPAPPTAPAAAPKPASAAVEQRPEVPPLDRPGRDTPGPIADPDPALLEPAPDAPSDMLPRIAPDGRMSMQVYAAGFDRSSRRPRIALLIAGIGLNVADSTAAVHDLPGAVTLAISPYATRLQDLLAATRLAEHEYLLSIPMEPQGFPLNDPGSRALMTNLAAEDNLARLNWVLARTRGYAGVTNALGDLRGERFSGMTDQMDPVLAAVARRGLLYVDARPAGSGGAATLPHAWSRDVDLVIDEPPAQIDQNLADLERIARDKGSALGLAGAPRPLTVQHIAAWTNGLLDRGAILAPVSALAVPPAATGGAK